MQRSKANWTIHTLDADILKFEAKQFFIDIITIKRKSDETYDLRIEFDDNYISLDDKDALQMGFFPRFINTFYTKLGSREIKIFHADLPINILTSKSQPIAVVKALFDTLQELKSFGTIKDKLFSFIELTLPAALPTVDSNKLFPSVVKAQQQVKTSSLCFAKNR